MAAGATTDPFATAGSEPAAHAYDISAEKSDSVDLSHRTRAIYVGGAGDVKVVTAGGDTVTFKAVPVGTVLPIQVKQLFSTGTTATLLLGLY